MENISLVKILRASFSKSQAGCDKGHEICSLCDMSGEITPKTHPEIIF